MSRHSNNVRGVHSHARQPQIRIRAHKQADTESHAHSYLMFQVELQEKEMLFISTLRAAWLFVSKQTHLFSPDST